MSCFCLHLGGALSLSISLATERVPPQEIPLHTIPLIYRTSSLINSQLIYCSFNVCYIMYIYIVLNALICLLLYVEEF